MKNMDNISPTLPITKKYTLKTILLTILLNLNDIARTILSTYN